MASNEVERALPRRLRKRAAECLRVPLQRVDELWRAGRIHVVTAESDAKRLLPLETLVFAEDHVLLDGSALEPPPPHAYALLNKPKHVTSTSRDPDGASNLAPYLAAMPRGCFAVGRLDRETTGLLLCTSDGDLATAVLRPDHETTKAYWLWLDETVADDDPRLSQMLEGVVHNGQRLTAASARIFARHDYATELELTLTQGRKRQIRHMCRMLGFSLVHLHRRRIGPLTDAGLALGTWRLLSDAEISALWQAAGGRAHVRERQLAALGRLALTARNGGAPHTRLEHWLAGERS